MVTTINGGNVNINTNLMAENQGVAKGLAAVKETLSKTEEMLKLKDDIIKAKEEVINMLRMQLHPAVITTGTLKENDDTQLQCGSIGWGVVSKGR